MQTAAAQRKNWLQNCLCKETHTKQPPDEAAVYAFYVCTVHTFIIHICIHKYTPDSFVFVCVCRGTMTD